jgi:hypothetical protein
VWAIPSRQKPLTLRAHPYGMTLAPALNARTPAYTIREVDAQGHIDVTIGGFFNLGTLSRYFREMDAIVARWRAAGRPIRLLISATGLQPSTQEMQAFAQDAVGRIFLPGDRIAIIVESSLVKMQLRRVNEAADVVHFFVSKNAAMTWMRAYMGAGAWPPVHLADRLGSRAMPAKSSA